MDGAVFQCLNWRGQNWVYLNRDGLSLPCAGTKDGLRMGVLGSRIVDRHRGDGHRRDANGRDDRPLQRVFRGMVAVRNLPEA